ncbi:MAG: hypothetical protein HQL79_07580 [Magnetococcales bacterium]|nr:hypothetical protein [Magnetococcales bacterium]
MMLMCPCCQAVASLEAWTGNVAARNALAAISQLPGAVVRHTPGYLALFRPTSERGLPWEQVQKVVAELNALIGKGTVVHSHKAARPCPPEMWGVAMETVLAQVDKVKRPLKGHGYLITIAYGLADEADAAREKKVEQERAGRSWTKEPEGQVVDYEQMKPITPEKLAEIKKKSQELQDKWARESQADEIERAQKMERWKHAKQE